MAFAEADANVALESDVIAGREFESVESGDEDVSIGIQGPLTEDGGVSGATVLISNQMCVVVVGYSVTAAGESTINSDGFDLDLKHETVSDDGAVDFVAGRQTDLHGTDRRWARVRDGAGRGQHGDVEADGDTLLGRVVDTAHTIGLGLEGHQLGMFLDDQDERSLAVDQHQTAGVEAHLVIDGADVAAGLQHLAALFIL